MGYLSIAMKSTEHCRVVDHRKVDPNKLSSLLLQELEAIQQPSLLWIARRPKKRWHLGLVDWHPHLLSSAPQHEEILWLAPEVACSPNPAFVEHCEHLLNDYKALFQGKEPISECQRWRAYRKLLLSHIEKQEKKTFPDLKREFPIDRPLRELGYEHRGLERGLEQLPPILQRARDGQLSKKEREQVDLDFFHLLEHHVERERDALSPIQVFLNSRIEGVYRS